MQEYIILIAYLTTAIVASDGFWQSSIDADTNSVLQARRIDEYLRTSSETAGHPKIGRQSLIIRALGGKFQELPSQRTSRTPLLRTPSQGQKVRVGEPQQRLSTPSPLRSTSQWQQRPVKASGTHVKKEHQAHESIPKTKHNAKASITAQGPASLSVNSFATHEDFTKPQEDAPLKFIDRGIDATLKTGDKFGATATGFARDLSPSSGRRSKEAIKAKARGSAVFTKVVAPTGGRGHIIFKESGKKTEVVDVPGGETVEEHRLASKGPIQATAKVSRGGHLRVGSIYEEGNRNHEVGNGKHELSNGKYGLSNGHHELTNGKHELSNGQRETGS